MSGPKLSTSQGGGGGNVVPPDLQTLREVAEEAAALVAHHIVGAKHVRIRVITLRRLLSDLQATKGEVERLTAENIEREDALRNRALERTVTAQAAEAKVQRLEEEKAADLDKRHEVLCAFHNAWPHAEDIPASWPDGFVGNIEELIKEREDQALEHQLWKARAQTLERERDEAREALAEALAAIATVREASFIEWSEDIAPSKRGQEDDDEARRESKDAVWHLLNHAELRLRAALASTSGSEVAK